MAVEAVRLGIDGSLTRGADRAVDDVLGVLGHPLELVPALTLRSYFRMLLRYPLLARTSPFFSDLLGQYGKLAPEGCHWNDCDTLEFSKTVEMVGFPGDPKLEIYLSLWGRKGDAYLDLKLIPLGLLLDMPLALGQLRHVIFGDSIDTFVFDTVYTLFEFVDGVAWQLGFQSAPEACLI